MTHIIIAISLWCGGTYVSDNSRLVPIPCTDGQKGCAKVEDFEERDVCRQRVVQCMQKKSWKESELVHCLGVNR